MNKVKYKKFNNYNKNKKCRKGGYTSTKIAKGISESLKDQLLFESYDIIFNKINEIQNPTLRKEVIIEMIF